MKKSTAQPKADKKKTETLPAEDTSANESLQTENANEELVEENKAASTAQPKADILVDAGTVTYQVISSSATPNQEDKRLVKMTVKYPEDFKGKRYLKDGATIAVSPETAEQFEKKGIAYRI